MHEGTVQFQSCKPQRRTKPLHSLRNQVRSIHRQDNISFPIFSVKKLRFSRVLRFLVSPSAVNFPLMTQDHGKQLQPAGIKKAFLTHEVESQALAEGNLEMKSDFSTQSASRKVLGIPVAQLRDLYRLMVRIRFAEEAIAELVRDEAINSDGELVYDTQGRVVRIKKQINCPCHLCTGQEAIPVGMCAHLSQDDYVFGNHRSHGHYLAKGGGLFEMMAELFGRAEGCAGGRGGSMHLVDVDVGIPGTTPIVASSISHAVGAALATHICGGKRVTVSFFGDGATEAGRFHEGLIFAAYHKLPIVFVCENNLYSSHIRLEERRLVDNLAAYAAPAGMPGICANGNNLFEVYHHAKEAIDRARSGAGPSLLEFRTYRLHGHVGANLDLEKGIRNRMEFDLWRERDPLRFLEEKLLSHGVLTQALLEEMKAEVQKEVDGAIEYARSSPEPQSSELLTNSLSFTSEPCPHAPVVRKASERPGDRDHDKITYGEVNSPWYVGNSTTGLHRRFGTRRVIETPVSEDSITGAVVGAAMAGMRPILIHPRMDFALLAVEQLVGQAANWRYMTAGKVQVPLVARLIVNRGGEQGAQHSQSLQAMFAHVPGLIVVMPATAYDAKGLLISSVLSNDPVIYIDDRWAYGESESVPKEVYTLPLGKGLIRCEGSDVTVVATSYMNRRALEAAEVLRKEGITVEVIDPRTIKPIDTALIVTSVAKTGRLLVADGGWDAYGFTAEVAAVVAESPVVSSLKAPVRRFGLPPCPAPASAPLEKAYYGSVNTLVQAIRELVRFSG